MVSYCTFRRTIRGRALNISVKGSAAQALRDWIAVAAVKQGAIFRAVNKHGKISSNPLSPIDINRIVKNCCKAAGLNEKQFGAHSLRSGFLMQEATVSSEEAAVNFCI